MDLSLDPTTRVLSPDAPWPPGCPFLDQHGQTIHLVLETPVESPLPSEMTAEEQEKIMAEARQSIQAKYDKGEVFFSKQVLLDIANQLDRCLDGSDPERKVSVTALDGTVVKFIIQAGKKSRSDWPGYEVIRTKPHLTYRTLHQLTTANESFVDPERAYLPIDIRHSTEIREAETNKVVSPWPMPEFTALRDDWQREWMYWEDSDQIAKLKSIIMSAGVVERINNVVAFGCGSITYLRGWPLTHRSMSQHALMLAMKTLAERGGIKPTGTVKCYAQDPIYAPLDEQVLGEAGITLLDDPRAFLQVGEGSVVISILPSIPVHDVIADIARPVAIIASYPLPDHYVSPRAKDMLANEYVRMDFSEHSYFENTVIYIRKTAMPNLN